MTTFFRPFTLALFGSILMTGCIQNSYNDVSEGGDAPAIEEMDERADEVLTVVNSLFQAMQARDSTRIKMTLHPDATLTSINLMEEGQEVRHIAGRDFVASVGQPGPAYIERMFDPEVRVDGDFADVFTRYDFHVADSLTHCGTDAIQLVRNERGAWRIVGITYTREACQ